MQNNETQSELLRWEKEFAKAVVCNDAGAIGKFLADDWMIVDPDGNMIDKARFIGVINNLAQVVDLASRPSLPQLSASLGS